MRIHNFFWALFVLVILVYGGLYFYIRLDTGCFLDVFSISTENVSSLRNTLDHWQHATVGNRNLLYYGKLCGVWIDWVWILAYVPALIMFSYNLMQQERRPFVNNFLRFNMLLAFIAGVLDILEDSILFYDMNGFGPQKHLISSAGIAWPKWCLLAIILIVCLFSWITRASSRKNYYSK